MSPLTQTKVGALEGFCLARLGRFARLASEPDLDAVPAWRRLARHATFSAYRDCLALGLGAEARGLLASTRRGDGAPPTPRCGRTIGVGRSPGGATQEVRHESACG